VTEFNDINLPADFDDLSKHAPLLDKLRAKGGGFVVPDNYFKESLEFVTVGGQLSAVGGKDGGFIVPENYFEELTERIISIVNLTSLDKNKTTDSQQPTANSFPIPENYFEELSERIISIVNLTSLDKNKTADSQEPTANSFEVPEGYFNELDETLNTKLALDNLKQDEGFDIPEGYFEKLSEKILSRAAVDELNQGSDAEVPAGYFDTLADRISARIAEENSNSEKAVERGRIIVFAEVLKRYARPVSIAASVTLLISVSIWFFNRSNNQTDHLAKYVPSNQHFTPVIPPVQKNDFLVVPKNNVIAFVKTPKHNSLQKVNHSQSNDVKVQIADVMNQVEQIDENSIADFAQNNSDVSTIQQEKLSNEAISNYIIDSNIDANDLINGINNKTP
jgi:hypothetical protein